MNEKTSFLVVLPGGQDYYEDAAPLEKSRGFTQNDHLGICERAVRKAGLTTPRRNPQKVPVTLFRLRAIDGELKRQVVNTYEVMPPLTKMTSSEYQVELQLTLRRLPEVFREFVASESYERGHSSGYEECLYIAYDLAHKLWEVIAEYDGKQYQKFQQQLNEKK